jgi:cobalt-zinc-cadmium resistance protein CzcA
MLSKIIDFCLRNRAIVMIATLLCMIIGAMNARRLPFDAFPDTTPVQVQVNANTPAWSPAEVERQVTFPLEQTISGIPGLQAVRSVSKFGFMQITAIFDDSTDGIRARQLVAERIAAADLPESVDKPTLGPMTTGLGEVFQYLIQSSQLSAAQLRTLHQWVIRPQMLQVPGVAEINTWGGDEKQIHVVVDPLRLAGYDLTLAEVENALKMSNRNAGGGLFDEAGEATIVQGQGVFTDLHGIENVTVALREGVAVTLGMVANVREDHAIARGAVSAQGEGEAVLGLAFMLNGANSREITKQLEERLALVARSLPPDVTVTPVYRRSDLVAMVLQTVQHNLVESAALVIAVLLLFLGNIRAGLIVAATIPMAMLFAVNAMILTGISGSLMSLGALDFGMVVDSSVIMVENAQRRLQSDRSSRTTLAIIRDAAVEVRKPTLFGECVVAVVYVPILALQGMEGKLFRPMAWTVVFALAGSMLLSLTVMPVLATYVLRKGGRTHENRLGRALVHLYARMLAWALARRKIVLWTAASAVLGAGMLATQLGREFVPRLREQAVVINTVRVAGVSLAESVRYGTLIERRLLARFPAEIEHIWTRTGSAEVATDPMGLEVSDVFITLKSREQWKTAATQDELVSAMNESLQGLPGMRAVFTQPIEMRLQEMTAGIRSDVGIKIFGDDLAQVQKHAQEIGRAVQAIPGAADFSVEQVRGHSTLSIAVDRVASARNGLRDHEVIDVIEALGGRKVGEFYEQQKRFDLVLRLDAQAKSSLQALQDLIIVGQSGARANLGSVAAIRFVDGPASISREWAQRRVSLQVNVRGRDLGDFVDDVRRILREEIALPVGVTALIDGKFAHYEAARERLAVVVPVALTLIFTLLYVTYRSSLDALRVFSGVPFGAVGGIVALHFRGLPFSIAAAVGFIALFGVSVLGDMVLVSRIRHLEAKGIDVAIAVVDAASTRIRPVLMTSLVAALGFVPMAINTGVGAEVQRPLATVVIGGMLTSTLATLIVLPTLYFSANRRRR